MSLFLLALAAAAPFTIAETGQGYPTLAAAVAAVRDGTATILIAPGTYHECVVQAAGRITYKAVQSGTAIFERVVCEDKAAFVLRGRGSAVEGVVFRKLRARVAWRSPATASTTVRGGRPTT